MIKLFEKDVVLLGEGKQLKNAIKDQNKDLRDFLTKNNIPICYNTFRTYLSRDKIYSDSFRACITRALNIDYNDIVKSKPQQLKAYVWDIFYNIKLYTEEEDFETFEKLIKLCIKYELSIETAIMYRAKAKNCYFRNKVNHTLDLYDCAIDTMPGHNVSKLVFLYSEVADICFREAMDAKAEHYFDIARQYIEKYKIDNYDLHYYHYLKGIMHVSNKNYSTAKEHFEKAAEFATFDPDKGASIANIGLAYKKEKDYYHALKYYNEALKYLNEDNKSQRSSIYNNIAEVYRLIQDYESATKYIDMSIELSGSNITFYKHLLHLETFAEIQIQMGNYDSCGKYFEALLSTIDKQIDKIRIKNGIKNIIEIAEDVDVLKKLSDVVIKIIETTRNEEHRKNLYECVGIIYIKIKRLGGTT